MNEYTSQFESVERYQVPTPEKPRSSRVLTAVAVVMGILLGIGLIVLFVLLVGGRDADTGEPVAPRAEATATPVVEQPVAPAPAPAPQPASNNGNVAPPPPAPHVDPPAPPVVDPPETYLHPLDGTVWDVMAYGDGAGSNYDIHPSFAHQIEFRDGRVYSHGDVNGGSAQYSIDGDEYGWGNELHCGPVMTTLMLGPADAMFQEGIINTALENAAYYEIFEHTLMIKNGSGDTLLFCDVVPGG